MEMQPVNVADVRLSAQKKLPKMIFDYYDGGAADEVTLRSNEAGYERLRLIPRVLKDVSTALTIDFPILVAPAAMQAMAHPEGEAATARAASQLGTVMILSTVASMRLSDVAKSIPKHKASSLWLQLYLFKNREFSLKLVREAEKAGFSALVLTVDSPVSNKRERDIRNRFRYPDGMIPENFRELFESDPNRHKFETISNYNASLYSSELSWEDVTWLMKNTTLPVLLKGILSPEDAVIAVDIGVAGIIVSNHGGRQLDVVAATIDVLPLIVKAVRQREKSKQKRARRKMRFEEEEGEEEGFNNYKKRSPSSMSEEGHEEDDGDKENQRQKNKKKERKPEEENRMIIMVDGGIRRGTSALLAMALGADAVLVGRPVLWGLACNGDEGVKDVLSLLRAEFVKAMALTGCASLKEIQPSLILRQPEYQVLPCKL